MEIRVLERQGRSIRQIMRETGLSRNTVRKYLRGGKVKYGPREPRACKLGPHKGYLLERIGQARPDWIPATVLMREICAAGYTGGISQLKAYLRPFKVARVDPVLRFETAPGQQMQVDFTTIRRGRDRLLAFVATLGYSHATFVRFTRAEQFADWRDGLIAAFESLLREYSGHQDVLVLGLPRGGVPVAFQISHALRAPLDVMIVRKLGAPGQPELAIGAVASGGVTVINEGMLACVRDPKAIEHAAGAERVELARRERAYRGTRPPLTAKGRTVILVDDGAATGASMLAAVRAARKLDAKTVVVALPVASVDAHRMLARQADKVICLMTPLSFYAVGQWYEEFTQTTDEEVTDLLARSNEVIVDPTRAASPRN